MIVWLRHGQSTWNAAGRLQGQTAHPPLTELGRQQAAVAAEALRDDGIVNIVSSPAVRARQTAAIVGVALGLDVHLDPRLIEQGLSESIESVERRLDSFSAALSRLADRQPVLLVSHGDVIALALHRLTGVPLRCPENAEIHRTNPDLLTFPPFSPRPSTNFGQEVSKS